MANTLKIHTTSKGFNGSIPTGSKLGKVLLNSIDASKIMEAVRNVASGIKVEPVTISKDTVKSLDDLNKK